MKSSLDKLFNHVSGIERMDAELGRFLTLFANLTTKKQGEILREIDRLKQESNGDKEGFLEEVKAFATMYGAFQKNTEGKEVDEAIKTLGIQIGQIQVAAAELQKARTSVSS
jgi:hypothetical protein